MGNCNFKTETVDKTSTLSISTFNFHYVIGRGGFGKVWKVERKSNKVVYAMKEMSKSRIISKKSVASVMNERHLLSVLKHPFLVNMVAAFQDRENLYLIMDLMTGGDLRYHISRRKKFTEEQTKFFIACIISSLEYLHNQGILHRDIKPENLVFDAQGYLRITDFGIARVWKADNSNETSGTPGYMAPEVMCRQNHGISVDYYALGVIAYECMLGRRPYVGRNRKEIRDQILAKQVQLRRTDIPENWSLESADFINKLIQRKPINRLGQEGPSEVKNHPWLKDFPWGKLHDKELEPPFNPNEDQLGVKQSVSNTNWDDENSDVMKQNAILLRRGSVQELFNGYNFDLTITTTMTTSGPLTPHLKQSNSKHFVQSPSLSSQTPRLISSPTSVEPHQPSMQKEF